MSAVGYFNHERGWLLYSASLQGKTRQYNGRGQMTRQTFDTFDIQYAFPSVGNDRRLERRVFTGPGISEDVSYTYDLNGNLTQSPFGTYTFDSANRLTRAESGAGVEEYGYAASNQRLWKKKSNGTVEVYFYLPDGRLIATYEKYFRYGPEVPQEYCLTRVSDRIWFGGLLLAADREAVYTDRLGSVVRKGTQVYRYYPHGEAFSGNPGTTGPGFATYERDQHAGLDQAWNRGYLSAYGRFAQADPYQASGGAGEPGSWNRYGYVQGDPVNFHDPRGLLAEAPPSIIFKVNVTVQAIGGMSDIDWALLRMYWTPHAVPGGGGGGGTSTTIRVENYSTTSTAAVAVQNVLRWLKEAMARDDSCDRWLQNSGTTIDFLLGQAPGWKTMFAGVGELPADPTINAVAGVTGTTLAAGASGLVVNVNGAFFNRSLNAELGTNIQGGTDAAKVFILLHELAHLTGAAGFLSNDRNDEAQRANNAQVLENCGRTVSRAAGVLP